MWKEVDNHIEKEFSFDEFKAALAFVNKVGELAENANHHPDIELGWGRAKIMLTSHDAGGVTDKDHELAKQIDAI